MLRRFFLLLLLIGMVVPVCGTPTPEGTPAAELIAMGNLVAERNEDAFKKALMQEYPELTEAAVNKYYLMCNRNWGSVAYLMILDRASKLSADEVLAVYHRTDDWSAAARELKLAYSTNVPRYKLDVLTTRQITEWLQILKPKKQGKTPAPIQ